MEINTQFTPTSIRIMDQGQIMVFYACSFFDSPLEQAEDGVIYGELSARMIE